MATLGVYVKVRAGLNILSQEVTWELLTIDPETGKNCYTHWIIYQNLGVFKHLPDRPRAYSLSPGKSEA